ncbi:hypothetical protein EBR66_08820 [bacterium]|nr:hypothetical protein [bacterium]
MLKIYTKIFPKNLLLKFFKKIFILPPTRKSQFSKFQKKFLCVDIASFRTSTTPHILQGG